MRVLVCGGRDYSDKAKLNQVLNEVHRGYRITTIIEGDASGADRLAGTWARLHNVPNLKFPAHWRVHGYVAGHIRNKQMLEEGKPDLVIAFPGGKGTMNMVEQAKRAGVITIQAEEFS